MKKKLFFVGLAVALLSITSVIRTASLAAKPVPFSASGSISAISSGEMCQLGESGRWVVSDRELTGMLTGDISEEYTMTYKANVELETQAGPLHGRLQAGQYVLIVNGQIEPLEMVPSLFGQQLPKLTITGNWTFGDGSQGHGNFEGWAIFIPTTEEDPIGPGHVKEIIDSEFILEGEWQPED